MKKGIIVTGTPGTGKTTISNELKHFGYSVVHVGELVKERHLYEYFEEETQSYVVDDDVLTPVLVELVEKNDSPLPLVLDGHVAILPSSHLSYCIVLRCSIKTLRERLSTRDYSKEKIDENVEAELMEILLTEMLELYGPENVHTIYTDDSVDNCVKQIVEKIGE